jgi:PBP1b-binding outer membrane lipoprotein LpoB
MIKFGPVLLLLLLLSGCIVFPLSIVDRPEIIGMVKDVDGNPISGARVTIIGSRTVNSMIEDYEVDSLKSDKSGQIIFKKINGIDWVHNYKILARSSCQRRISIEAVGFISQKLTLKYKGEYNRLNDNLCKNVKFKFESVLKKQLTRTKSTPSAGRAEDARPFAGR